MAGLIELAVREHQAGRLDEAHRLYREALGVDPRNADALRLLGLIEQQRGRPGEAAAWLERAARIAKTSAVVLNDLGKAYFADGRPADAKKCFARAVSLKPDDAEIHGNLGAALADLGDPRGAVASLRRAIALRPAYPNAHYNLGRTLQAIGEPREAERAYRAALALDPGMAEAHYNLSNLFNLQLVLGRFADAEQSFRRALERDPDDAAARWALAVARMCALDAAEDESGRSAAEELRSLADWLATRSIEHPEQAIAIQPFYLAYREKNHRELLAQYGALCAAMMRRWQERERLATAPGPRSGRVRLGIVSSQVYGHSTWRAVLAGWVRHIDRARFELAIFHLGRTHDDDTERAVASAARFEEGPARSLRDWADAIVAWRPDALVYPAIAQDGQEARLAALRLAPLQLATWGHPETSGFPTIDAYVSAEAFEPGDADAHYSERLVRLPGIGACYSRAAPAAAEPDWSAIGLDPREALLLCTGSPFKYAPGHDAAFPEIARRAPGARLVFFRLDPAHLSQTLEARLREAFSRAGMDFDRHARFVPKLPQPAFYGLMLRAAAWLDTAGYSGFNTVMQAVECALPVVAREGRFMRGRFASGVLRRMGMDEWVARTDDEYVELAAALASDEPRRRAARARIEAARDVLFDDLAPVRALEDFLISATRPSASAGP